MSKKRRRKRLDITDEIYNRLQAIVIDWYKTKKTGKTHWFCQCECGNIVSVQLGSLRNGTTKSCGCLQKEIVSKIQRDSRIDLTGKRFDRWYVISYNPEKSKEMGRPYWDCICDCGTEKCVDGNSLRDGKSKSCGCLQKEIVIKTNKNKREDLTGQLFTRWYVIGYNPKKSEEMGTPCYDVVCTNDGNKGCVRVSALLGGHSKSCGCLIKESMQKTGKKYSGKNHYNWKGGVTPLKYGIRKSQKYKKFHKKVFERDNYTCLISKEKGGELNVHHIKGFAKILEENNVTIYEQAMNCEELWNIDNAITLSEKWHSGIKTDNPNAFHRLYGYTNFTEEDFYEWFNKYKITEKVSERKEKYASV